MSLIVIVVSLVIAWMVKKRTNSTVWAIAAFAVAFLVFPLVTDQLNLLLKPGTTNVVSGTQSTSCNCS